MFTVIGLGGVGCRIGKVFSQYPQYSVVCIDTQDSDWKDQVVLEKRNSLEDYENNYKPLPQRIKKKIKEDVIFVLSGSSDVASASLRLLQQISDKNIHIIYIRPELDLLDEKTAQQEKMVFSILQEYTRSGLFKEIYLTSNSQMDTLIKDASIREYYPAMNNLIVNVFHMIKVFEHQEAEVSSFPPNNEARRICTLGIMDIESGEEKDFFSIDMKMDNRLYYGISKETLSKDKTLQRSIIKSIKSKNSDLCKYSYSVYETKYDYDFCYTKIYSSKVQDFN